MTPDDRAVVTRRRAHAGACGEVGERRLGPQTLDAPGIRCVLKLGLGAQQEAYEHGARVGDESAGQDAEHRLGIPGKQSKHRHGATLRVVKPCQPHTSFVQGEHILRELAVEELARIRAAHGKHAEVIERDAGAFGGGCERRNGRRHGGAEAVAEGGRTLRILADSSLMQNNSNAPVQHASPPAAEPSSTPSTPPQPPMPAGPQREIGGPPGPEPTRFGDWEKNGRCIDF
jgi:hypothetical protein